MIRRINRRGMTLAELVIAIAVMGLIALVGAPALSGALAVKQQSSVKNLGQTYIWLLEEAALRNVSFRVAFNLDNHSWKVEVGEPEASAFRTPEEAEEHRTAIKRKMRKYTKRQIDAGEVEIEDEPKFNALQDDVFKTKQTLPEGLVFDFVYTPQYGEDGIRPNIDGEPDPEEPRIAYSHIFPDGSAEHTVVRIIEEDNPDEGYSLEVEPISGKIRLTDEIVTPKDSLDWIPEEAPTIR